MTLKIISAQDIVFQGEVTSLVSTLAPGIITYTDQSGEQSRQIQGGLADVDHNVVSVCLY